MLFPFCFQEQPEAWAGFYLDDSNVNALLEALEVFLAEPRLRLPSIGLSLNLRKTILLTTCPQVTHQNLAQVNVVNPASPASGFKVLGIPMGGAEFVETELARTVYDVRHFCERTLLLEHPQAALLLLRMCCGTCKVLHLLKVLPPDLADNLVLGTDETMMSAFTKLSGVPLVAPAKQQLTLPVRLGGFGLTRAAAIAPVAAFVDARFSISTPRPLSVS